MAPTAFKKKSNTCVDSNSISETLRTIALNPNQHFLWLNTLSLLEHIGSRKILMTQSGEETSEMILRHATEEARHALFFKKAAGKVKPEISSGYEAKHLMRGVSAKIYFAKLDASVRKELRTSFGDHPKFSYLAYLYTTTVIEKRAMVVYNLYDEILLETNQNFHLKNLILEEEGHLSEMLSEIKSLDLDWETRLVFLEERESKLFWRFWSKIQDFSKNLSVF